MPTTYFKDETKQLMMKAARADKRTLDGEINYLATERLKELGIDPDAPSPSVAQQSSKTGARSQGKKKQAASSEKRAAKSIWTADRQLAAANSPEGGE